MANDDAKKRGDVTGRRRLRPPAIDPRSSTVSEHHRDMEATVLGPDIWAEIHRRGELGQTISAIARELGLDRKTVRSCMKKESWSPYRREAKRPTLLDPHWAWLRKRAPEVGYSARILHQELCSQRGFTGCYELVKVAIRPLRSQSSLVSLTQARFETAPGEQAQVDWGQVTVWMAGERVKIHVFVMTLGYSRRGYAEGFMNERMASLLTAHENAFFHFGGYCQTLLYDRMRTVTIGSYEDDAGLRRARLNERFQAFADHWGFVIRLCQPYRAQTKGKVESGVKYIKRNFLPGRCFHDLEDFNAQLFAWQVEVADVRVHGTTHQRPIDRFAQEKAALTPLVGHRGFVQSTVHERVVAQDWLVSLDANRYSVPFRLIGKTVQATREGGHWVIRHRGDVVAEHAVLAGRAQLSVKPEHGPGALPRNTRQRFSDAHSYGGIAQTLGRDVQVRDLAIYEQLLHAGNQNEHQERA